MDERLRIPLASVAAIALLLAIGGVVAPVRAAGTNYGPPLECPPPTVTLQMLISMRRLGGPLATRYGEPALNERASECLSGAELTFLAFRAAPEGLGGAITYGVQPAWIDTWNEAPSFLALTDEESEPGILVGPFLAVAVRPDLRDRFEALRGQWASVRGHFDDPAARTCRLRADPTPEVGRIPTRADLVAMCRTSFVVSGIDPVPPPCPAAPIDWAAISSTPEHLRADCFGGQRFTFTARGFSINNAWPLVLPEVDDWELLDPAGGTDVAEERAKALGVFLPRTVAVPNPTDAPWHDSDGLGGFDVQWRIEGHFDDGRAVDCRPNLDGVIVDGRLHVWSDDDARDFCRNHMFVDALEWIRPSPAATSATPTSAQPESQPRPSTGGEGPVVLAALGILAVALTLVAGVVRRRARSGRGV